MKLTTQLGEIYYSVGPLQHSGIERWEWTNDRYDKSRLELGNVFKTIEEAEAFKQQIMDLKQKD